jgi:cell wall-associated NlpC family hydrolase
MIEVPSHFLTVSYDGNCYPGAPGVSGLAQGANCQQFAYELLRHFGKQIPDFRSSDLWEDVNFTREVTNFEPLDLLLYNATPRAWGAHVAVYLGDGHIIHLSNELVRPVIWTHEQFISTPRYCCFIGAKRVQ